MSTTSRRVLAVTVATIVAVLTGILAGMLGTRTTCTARSTAAPGAVASPVATGDEPGSGVGSSGGGTAGPASAGVLTCTRQGFAAAPALAGAGGAALAGLVALILPLLGGARQVGAWQIGPPQVPVHTSAARLAAAAGGRPGAGAPDVAAPTAVAAPAAGRAEADRDALVRACIYVRDRLTSRALADRLGAALQEVGVSVVEPTGERFDPARHEAGGAAASDEPGRAGTIAAVEVPGYTDRGRVLRAPVVTVYQAAAGRHADREER
jgi:hypothetical protein